MRHRLWDFKLNSGNEALKQALAIIFRDNMQSAWKLTTEILAQHDMAFWILAMGVLFTLLFLFKYKRDGHL